MNSSILVIISIMPLMATLNLLTNQSHFLMALLSLEGIMLTLVMFIPMIASSMNAPNTAVSIILLTFGACEASLGLSLMVMMSRSYGTDTLNALTSNKC